MRLFWVPAKNNRMTYQALSKSLMIRHPNAYISHFPILTITIIDLPRLRLVSAYLIKEDARWYRVGAANRSSSQMHFHNDLNQSPKTGSSKKNVLALFLLSK